MKILAKDSFYDTFESAYRNVVSEWKEQGLTDAEIIEKLNNSGIEEKIPELLDNAAQGMVKYFVDKKYEVSYTQKIDSDRFLAHQNEIWGDCFVTSETMYVMAIEAAEFYSEYVNEKISPEDRSDKQYTFLVLQYIQGRCCQEFLEILYLMKFGFADCAYARWRSMYELCCNASFIVKFGETIAKQYFEQSQTEEHKYSWTKGSKKEDGTELKITTFQGIQDNCDVNEEWKKQYKLACFINHGSPQGTFRRLCLLNDQNVISVGHSDYGITTAAEYSAVSLSWITSMFLSIFPCMDAYVFSRMIHNWVDEIRKMYFEAENNCFSKSENAVDNNC